MSSRVLTRNESGMPPASGAWVRNAVRVVIRGSRSARQPIRPMSAARTPPSGPVAGRACSRERLYLHGLTEEVPMLTCRVQSGASDELPRSGRSASAGGARPDALTRHSGIRLARLNSGLEDPQLGIAILSLAPKTLTLAALVKCRRAEPSYQKSGQRYPARSLGGNDGSSVRRQIF